MPAPSTAQRRTRRRRFLAPQGQATPESSSLFRWPSGEQLQTVEILFQVPTCKARERRRTKTKKEAAPAARIIQGFVFKPPHSSPERAPTKFRECATAEKRLHSVA